MTNSKDIPWDKLKAEESYKLSMAEFKGATIKGMQDLKENIKDVKDGVNNHVKSSDKVHQNLQSQVNNIKLISAVFGGVGGIIVAALAALGIQRR